MNLSQAALGGNAPFVFTWFEAAALPRGSRLQLPNDQAALEWLEHTARARVLSLPLIKLGTFEGDYRLSVKLESVSGIEGDHDAGTLAPDGAAELLRQAGVSALVHTTKRHTSDKPRWRVLCPMSSPIAPAERRTMVGRLNGILSGALAPESFTAAQAFYIGNSDHVCRVPGTPIDMLTDLPSNFGSVSASNLSTQSARHEMGDPSLAAPSIEWLQRALDLTDPNNLSRADWIAITAAFKQAGWTLTMPDHLFVIWYAWCARYEGNDPSENHKNWQSIRNSEVGWPYLLRRVPQLIAEQYAPIAPVNGQVVLPPIDMPMDVTTGAPSVLTIVQALHEWNAPFAFDQFAGSAVLTGPLQRAVNQSYPRPVEDADATAIAILFNAMARKPATATIHEAISYYARMRPYNPVTDYLNSLQWDGLPRLASWLASYCGAVQSEWTTLIGRKVLIAMVARAMNPGCKVDTVLILEGLQGIGKSTAFEVLAGSDHFTDDLDGMQEKDDKMALMGQWVVEIGELSAMRRNEVDQVKRFIARKSDKFRLPFARNVSPNPRTCIFIGTTNSDEYLKDETGNRRFWPVRCSRIDLDGLRRDRDMLLAEAVHCFQSGEQWWLDGAENDLAAIEQDARTEGHDWEAIIAEHIAARHGVPFTTEDVIGWVGFSKASLNDPKVTRPIKRIMTRLGYKKSRPRRDNPGYREIYVLIGL